MRRLEHLPWDSDFKTQLAHEWNFTIERELPGRFGSRASYVGTHGGNLVQFDPINALVPRALAPGASVAQRRAYPDYNTSSTSTMDLIRTNGYSNSHQLQTEVKRNFEWVRLPGLLHLPEDPDDFRRSQ